VLDWIYSHSPNRCILLDYPQRSRLIERWHIPPLGVYHSYKPCYKLKAGPGILVRRWTDKLDSVKVSSEGMRCDAYLVRQS
jgi:hypothetical protein